MTEAMSEGKRILAPKGVGVVVFAHKTTAGWESQLTAMIDAGWIITGSWPIDTEKPGRMRANGSAALASSIHLVCRPRGDGVCNDSMIGDWRDLLRNFHAAFTSGCLAWQRKALLARTLSLPVSARLSKSSPVIPLSRRQMARVSPCANT